MHNNYPQKWDTATMNGNIMNCDFMPPHVTYKMWLCVAWEQCQYIFVSQPEIKLHWSKARVVLTWLQGQTGKANIDPAGAQSEQ